MDREKEARRGNAKRHAMSWKLLRRSWKSIAAMRDERDEAFFETSPKGDRGGRESKEQDELEDEARSGG